MEKVTIEDISLELFRISKDLILLADIASVVQPNVIESLLELSDGARATGNELLEMT